MILIPGFDQSLFHGNEERHSIDIVSSCYYVIVKRKRYDVKACEGISFCDTWKTLEKVE